MAERDLPPLPEASAASSTDASTTRPEDEGRLFPCESCGADLRFHVGVQQLQCPYCGATKEIDLDPEHEIEERDLDDVLRGQATQRTEAAASTESDLREIDCESCGATVQFTGTLTSSECPYCGVPIQSSTAHRAHGRIPVDGMLPFGVDRKTARKNLARWVQKLWFAPNDFKKRGVQGRFEGVYLPYWTFDSLTSNQYTGMRGDHYWVTVGSGKNRRRVRKTRWSPRSGDFQRFFDDVLVVAGLGLPSQRLRALEPWPLDRCVPFEESLLAGFLARTYDVPLEDGFHTGQQRMREAVEAETRRRIGGDVQKITSLRSRFDTATFKHLLLPVWMLAYRYKGKSYQVVVNAATGEVQGDRPWSAWKIALAVVAGLVVVGGIYWLIRIYG